MPNFSFSSPNFIRTLSHQPLSARKSTSTIAAFATSALLLLFSLCAAHIARAQQQPVASPYPKMAPLDQYLMARDAEIALARTAAPDSVSHDAEVLYLTKQGYESAVKGSNGFVCIVQRSWTANTDDPNFWNPKLRAPICFNPAGARTYLPIVFKKTQSILAGQSPAQMSDAITAAFDKGELPTLQPGAMCYMLSPQQYLSDINPHWHPHLMFFIAGQPSAVAWGADLPGSPILTAKDPLDRLTIFMIPVGKWSDGTPAPLM